LFGAQVSFRKNLSHSADCRNILERMQRAIHRALRRLGLHVERHRDAYSDLARFARDARLVVDGGAYQGSASQAFLKLFPAAEIHAFEPQPDLYVAMFERATSEPRWHVHSLALSDNAGFAAFHIPAKAFTGSLLRPDESFGPSRQVSVHTTTLDTVFAGGGDGCPTSSSSIFKAAS